jgi:hypothetical protein
MIWHIMTFRLPSKPSIVTVASDTGAGVDGAPAVRSR